MRKKLHIAYSWKRHVMILWFRRGSSSQTEISENAGLGDKTFTITVGDTSWEVTVSVLKEMITPRF